MEEVCRSFDSIIKSGKAHYWGTSEWSAANIFEAYMICERFNLIKPIVEQPQYYLIIREKIEKDNGKLFDVYKMGSTVWSPSGVLTGKMMVFLKIADQQFLLINPHLKEIINSYFGEENKEKYIKILKGLGEIAKQIGCSQAQLAMAWILRNKDIQSAITSATKPEQLEEVVGSIQFISHIIEIKDQINKLTGTQPSPDMDWRSFAPRVP